jgi:hypothetical protein
MELKEKRKRKKKKVFEQCPKNPWYRTISSRPLGLSQESQGHFLE